MDWFSLHSSGNNLPCMLLVQKYLELLENLAASETTTNWCRMDDQLMEPSVTGKENCSQWIFFYWPWLNQYFLQGGLIIPK